MISQKQLQEWQKQNSKDVQQYRKDEKYLQQLQLPQDNKVRSFFQRMRARYFNFHTEQHEKLNRLLYYTDPMQSISNYPKIMNAYLTYNTSAIVMFAACLLAPKKIISKIIISLVAFGLKVNIGDGLLTYYIVEQMALGNNMTQQEQELRNIMEFYYINNKFRGKAMTDEEQKKTDEMLENIRRLSEKFDKFKRVESLL